LGNLRHVIGEEKSSGVRGWVAFMSNRVQWVSLSIRWYSWDFYCPMCGTKLSFEEGKEPCPHILFVYESEAGEFAYIRDDLKSELEKRGINVQSSEIEALNALEVLEELLPENTVIFELTGVGVGCGLVACTTIVGIEFKEYKNSSRD